MGIWSGPARFPPEMCLVYSHTAKEAMKLGFSGVGMTDFPFPGVCGME
jgi:hypothetical protein